MVAARRQAALRAEGQDRHLAVHERRRLATWRRSTPSRCSPSTPARSIAETPFKDAQNPEKLKLARVVVVNDANGQQRNKLYPLQVGFKKHGQSGIEVSDWLPHLGDVHRRHRRHPLDVHDRRQPRRPDAVPLRPAHARRRVPDARRLGPLRPRLAQRQPAAVHLAWATANTGTRRTATTSAPPTTPSRCASTRPTRSTSASPKAPVRRRRAAARLRPRRAS